MSMQRSYYNQFASPKCHPLVTRESFEQEEMSRKLEDVQDVLQNLKRQECKYFPHSVAGNSNFSHHDRSNSNEAWRPIIIQWMYTVVDVFQLVPHIVPTAMYYLDQSIDTLMQCPSDYHLLGLTCLELAIKVHDTKMFPIEQLVSIGHANLTKEAVEHMEARLLRVLGWNLHPPTPHCFVHQYARLLPDNEDHASTKNQIVQTALHLVRQGLLYELAQPPSILAYACLLAAMEHDLLLSTRTKHAFCLHMLQVAGLSATTPGLAQAYQALVPILAPQRQPQAQQQQPPLQHESGYRQAQQCEQPSQISSPHSTMVPPETTQDEPFTQTAPSEKPNTQSLRASTSLLDSDQQQEQQREQEDLEPTAAATIVYSAGEELGFEVVTICPSEDDDYDDDDVTGDCQSISEKHVMGAGLSPRNVNGVISPGRL